VLESDDFHILHSTLVELLTEGGANLALLIHRHLGCRVRGVRVQRFILDGHSIGGDTELSLEGVSRLEEVVGHVGQSRVVNGSTLHVLV
jgi:hypothetical protein